MAWTKSCPVSVPHLPAPLPAPEWSPAVVEVHLVPMGQWGGQTLPADWVVETFEAGLWEVGCRSGPGIVMEHRAGTALMTDHALALCLQSQAEGSDWAV